MTTLPQQDVTGPARGRVRAGWLLIGAFLTGVFIIVVQVVFHAELDAQLVARALELGHRPPLEEYSRIQAQFVGPLLPELLNTLTLGLSPFVCLAAAIGSLRHSEVSRLLTAARWCALGALVTWSVQLYLDLSIKFGPDRWLPGAALFDLLYSPLAFATAWLGLTAVGCAALAIGRQQVAPRTALAALVVAALLAIGNLVLAILTGWNAGLPPLIPLIPALILGVGVVRGPTRQ